VDTDAKKVELFKKGLNAQLRERLMWFRNDSFNDLVSASIEQEDVFRACMDEEERKRKRPMSGPTGGAPQKYRLVYTPPAGQQSRRFPQPFGGANAHPSSSSRRIHVPPPTLSCLHRLGHLNNPRQLATRASTAGRSITLPEIAILPSKGISTELQCLQ
jgi:hypothetical protein